MNHPALPRTSRSSFCRGWSSPSNPASTLQVILECALRISLSLPGTAGRYHMRHPPVGRNSDADERFMTPDEIRELKELIEFLKEYDIGDFEFERGDFKVRLKFAQPVQAPPASALDIARLGQLLSPAGHTPTAASQGIHAVASAGSAAAPEASAAPVEA